MHALKVYTLKVYGLLTGCVDVVGVSASTNLLWVSHTWHTAGMRGTVGAIFVAAPALEAILKTGVVVAEFGTVAHTVVDRHAGDVALVAPGHVPVHHLVVMVVLETAYVFVVGRS